MSPFHILKRCYFRIKINKGTWKRNICQCPKRKKKRTTSGGGIVNKRIQPAEIEDYAQQEGIVTEIPAVPELQLGRLFFCSVKNNTHSP